MRVWSSADGEQPEQPARNSGGAGATGKAERERHVYVADDPRFDMQAFHTKGEQDWSLTACGRFRGAALAFGPGTCSSLARGRRTCRRLRAPSWHPRGSHHPAESGRRRPAYQSLMTPTRMRITTPLGRGTQLEA